MLHLIPQTGQNKPDNQGQDDRHKDAADYNEYGCKVHDAAPIMNTVLFAGGRESGDIAAC
jgi:hypothetical protein